MTPLSPYSCSPLPVYPSWLLKCRLSVRFVPWQILRVLCSLPATNTVLCSPLNWTHYCVHGGLSYIWVTYLMLYYYCHLWIFRFTVAYYCLLNIMRNFSHFFQAWTEKYVLLVELKLRASLNIKVTLAILLSQFVVCQMQSKDIFVSKKFEEDFWDVIQ